MSGLGISYVMIFFAAAALCLIFAAAWIVNSESKRNILKNEIGKLKNQVEYFEREKFMLLDEMNEMKGVPGAAAGNDTREAQPNDKGNAILLLQSLEQNAGLEKEIQKLKSELEEAKNSLEEIYKALVGQKP